MNKTIALLIAGLALATSTAQAELIANGGFVPSQGGWTVSGTAAMAGGDASRDTNRPVDGYYLKLADGNDSAPTDGVVYQVVSVSVGQAYDLSFDHSRNGTTIDLMVDVFDGAVDGADVATNPIGNGELVAVSLPTATAQEYESYSTTFTPTASEVTIRFSDIGSPTSSSRDLWVDNVQMTEAVPEPASFVLLAAAGLLGLGLRFRHRFG